MKLSIDVRGTLEIEKLITKHFPREVRAASITSLNKVNNQIRGKAAKRISNASGIKPIKLVRERITMFRAKRNRLAAGTYFKYKGISAEKLGKIKWNKTMPGAKVKSFYWKGSFAGTVRTGVNTGKQRVFIRVGNTGNNKSDLRAQSVSLSPHRKYHLASGRQMVRKNLRKIFVSNLQYRLSKK